MGHDFLRNVHLGPQLLLNRIRQNLHAIHGTRDLGLDQGRHVLLPRHALLLLQHDHIHLLQLALHEAIQARPMKIYCFST